MALPDQVESILQTPMVCERCNHVCRLAEAIPCIKSLPRDQFYNGPISHDGTGYGCPQPDCGGTMREVRPAEAR